VAESSPAERAGIERGDLIVRAAGEDVDGVDALYRALDALSAGSPLELDVLRGTDERRVTVSFDETTEAAAT
jgi:S1-C subfamily serine protease